MLTAPSSFTGKDWGLFSGPRRWLRLSALLHVSHFQPVCKTVSAIALLRQHDPEHAREEHARDKRCRLATRG
jgi:hypothetical protein